MFGIVLAWLAVGGTLGLAGGLAPGPITALVLRQSLRHGFGEGARVALAPILTDGPLLVLSAALALSLEGLGPWLGLLSLAGAVVVAWLAWESATVEAVPEAGDGPAGSLRRAVLANLVNPHPYVFWFTVGGPAVARATGEGAAAVGGFLVGFFGGLCGAKLVMAWVVSRLRRRIGGGGYRLAMRLLSAALLVFAVWLAVDGIARLAG